MLHSTLTRGRAFVPQVGDTHRPMPMSQVKVAAALVARGSNRLFVGWSNGDIDVYNMLETKFLQRYPHMGGSMRDQIRQGHV